MKSLQHTINLIDATILESLKTRRIENASKQRSIIAMITNLKQDRDRLKVLQKHLDIYAG